MPVKNAPSRRRANFQTANERDTSGTALARNFAAALALQQRGRLNEAEPIYKSILALDSNHFSSLHNLGYICLQQNRRDEAAQLLRRALKISPKSPQAWNTLGLVHHVAGEFREAAACFAKSLKYDPASAQAHNNLGASLHLLEEYDRAIICYRRALALNLRYADAHRNLGNALKVVGRIEDARSCYEAAIDLAPRQAANFIALADCKRFANGDRHLSAMEALARDAARLSERERIDLHFAMAKALADVGEHARSFAEVLAGNALKRQSLAYDEATTLRKFDRIKATLTAELIRERRAEGKSSAVPIFVIGMMRSGTSLIEQILASHPKVFGAGERGDFSREVEAAVRRQPDGLSRYPEALAALSAREIQQIGAGYVRSIRKTAPNAARVVDKMPTNFFFAGLIALALPNARIIHARRDPIDTCLSCLATDFQGDLPFAYDPGELGRYYQAYAALMRHWREALPPGTMIEVDYEELVSDLDGQARRLIAHCGLDWNPACLSFHTTQRVVLTASAAQVRRPIYRDSVGRARAYGTALRPLLDALGLINETAPPA